MFDYKHISFKPQWELSPFTIHKLGQCDALIRSFQKHPILPSIRKHFYKLSLIKNVRATTAIEGNTLTEKDIIIVRNNIGSVSEKSSYQEQEIRNMLEAYTGIRSDIVVKKIIDEIAPDFIKDLNRRVGEGIKDHFDADPGKFRSGRVHVGDYSGPDSSKVEDYVSNLCSWLKTGQFVSFPLPEDSIAESLIKAIVAHVYIVWIHPFDDGNGRAARLLEFYILLKDGMPDFCSHILTSHYNDTRPTYYDLLKKSSEDGDLTNFLDYAITGFLEGLNQIDDQICSEFWNVSWQAYAMRQLIEDNSSAEEKKRLLSIIKSIDCKKLYTPEGILKISPEIKNQYTSEMQELNLNDLKKLFNMGLLVQISPVLYKLNRFEVIKD